MALLVFFMQTLLFSLKLLLQLHGALRPEAWEMICELSKVSELKSGESFVRREGCFAYVAAGILKEYDAQQRPSPSIINFLGAKNCFVTRKQNQAHYLKTCMASVVYYWDYEALESLYQEFRELKPIYDGLCAVYDGQIHLRMRLLELSVLERIAAFKVVFKEVLPYLKKKDMANYLHLHYTHFLRHWNSAGDRP